jgi:hypothetical protein
MDPWNVIKIMYVCMYSELVSKLPNPFYSFWEQDLKWFQEDDTGQESECSVTRVLRKTKKHKC